MPNYKRFAVVGASGTVGSHLLHAFEHSIHGFDVTILTRKSGGNEAFAEDWKRKGAKIRPVDYDKESEVVHALSGIEVLVSTLGGPAFALQPAIVKAAKKAGVKLYVNSHWGSPMTAAEVPMLAPLDDLRNAALKVAEEVGLPWVEFRNGTFPDLVIPDPLFGLAHLKDRKATIYGDGNAQNSWTTQADTARYVIHVLRHLSEEQLHNRRFNIQGDLKSWNEIVKLYEEKYPGSSVQVTYRPMSELEEQAKNAGGDTFVLANLMLGMVSGKAKHNQDTLDNKEYPEWNPVGVKDVL